jgi:hypothetical protein
MLIIVLTPKLIGNNLTEYAKIATVKVDIITLILDTFLFENMYAIIIIKNASGIPLNKNSTSESLNI